ncbi:hypothetical protein N183_15320 [Sinorhizobium sp. Sb3]|uniref:hypothetical protein n=1 Tax=Sinorhizobium sp. Sb3 TaxID=1358417 RepID=UPI0007262847|nr:hypothetical protein [Sinorhizobium sp. Sb3]KSV81882.1 hypothetical protein N183_15320 [Sinorhizobium sp. Sb3]
MNERGQRYELRGSALRHLEKIVLYAAGPTLPEECRDTRYYVSEIAGFIHVFEREDYGLIVQTLGVPDEIGRYLQYREQSLLKLSAARTVVVERDVLAAYMNDEDVPSPTSHLHLDRLLDDGIEVDLAPVMNRLADHIQNPNGSTDYTRILLEFAKLPRSAWRAAKERLVLSIEAAKNEEDVRPFRFYFPGTDCSFMFASFSPGKPTVGPEGEQARRVGLQNLTLIAKYLHKAAKGIGVLVSKDGAFLHLGWCLSTKPGNKIRR